MLSIELQVRELEPSAKLGGKSHSLLERVCAVTVSLQFEFGRIRKGQISLARKDCRNRDNQGES